MKAAGSHELVQKLLDAYAAQPGAAELEVLPCGICEQEELLRDGRADVALMQRPFNNLAGFDSEELMTEGQIAVLPTGHPLATRPTLTLAEVGDVPDLPLARWPRDGAYPPRTGPRGPRPDPARPAHRPRPHPGRGPRLRPRLAVARPHRRPPDRRAARRHPHRLARPQPLPRPGHPDPHRHRL